MNARFDKVDESLKCSVTQETCKERMQNSRIIISGKTIAVTITAIGTVVAAIIAATK